GGARGPSGRNTAGGGYRDQCRAETLVGQSRIGGVGQPGFPRPGLAVVSGELRPAQTLSDDRQRARRAFVRADAVLALGWLQRRAVFDARLFRVLSQS